MHVGNYFSSLHCVCDVHSRVQVMWGQMYLKVFAYVGSERTFKK